MKRQDLSTSFIMMSLAVALLSACGHEKMELPVFELTKPESSEIIISAEGGEADIVFRTNNAWVAVEDEDCDWVSIEPGQGEAEKETYVTATVLISPNDVESPRDCSIEFHSGELSFTIDIKQDAYEAPEPSDELKLITPEDGKIDFTDTESKMDIVFFSSSSWQISLPEECGWLKADPASGEGDTKNQTSTISVSENESYEKREAVMTLSSGEKRCEIKVTQGGFEVYCELLNPEDADLELAPEGEIYELKFRTNNKWFAPADASAIGWLSAKPGSGDPGEECVLTIDCKPNDSGEERATFITIMASDDVSVRIDVTQPKMEAVEDIEIPDPVLKKYLTDNYDTNGDGEINTIEAKGVDKIICSALANFSDDKKVHSVEGIENFTNITYLKMEYGLFPSIDLTPFGKLTTANIKVNKNLTEVKVAGNKSVTSLNITNTGITSLDITGCESLDTLYCGSLGISSFDFLTGGENLKYIESMFNSHTSLDMSDFPKLEQLYIAYNSTPVTLVDFSNNPNFKRLDVINSSFPTSIDFSSSEKMEAVVMMYSNIEKIVFAENNPNLKMVSITSGNLTEIDFGNAPALETIKLPGHKIQSLDLTGMSSLTHLDMSGNKLTELSVEDCEKLFSINISGNNLGDISFLYMRESVRDIIASNCHLTEVDPTKLTLVKTLNVSSNLLSGELDVSPMPDAGLTVDVQNNAQLETVWISEKQEANLSNYMAQVKIKRNGITQVKVKK